jgi:hypothetical protein
MGSDAPGPYPPSTCAILHRATCRTTIAATNTDRQIAVSFARWPLHRSNRSDVTAGNPVKLFDGRWSILGIARSDDVSRDGRRFLMLKEGTSGQPNSSPTINVVLHWTEELEQRLPH